MPSSSSRPSRSVSSASLASVSTRRETPVRELSPAEKEKSLLIASACNNTDVTALVKLATSPLGLVSDSLRRTAWPLLLACPAQDCTDSNWHDLPPHSDEGQVALDVNRAFVYYPKHETDKQLDLRKEELSNVIVQVLRRHPALCYFQGYHDIVQVFLLVLGAPDAPAPVARLSLLRIRDFMVSSLDPAISQLELLHPILSNADPDLYDHLPKSQPSFALAGTITMFAHNIQEYSNITRLFDFFLAHHAVMPIYFFAAVVLSRREELLEFEKDEEDIMHAVLGKLPQPFDVEFHIARAMELYERLRPEDIGKWRWWKISKNSVLKTSATPNDLKSLSLEDGEKYLKQQEKEVQRQQALRRASQNLKYVQRRLWYYRRQGTFGLAVLVGIYAIWLGRNGGLSTRHTNLGPAGDWLKRIMGVFM